ncbi:MAG: FkbM family methyltransferase [Lentisphaeria bacterium]|nr:FkbM family methyltransferase [Lentisphaeria bacterium]
MNIRNIWNGNEGVLYKLRLIRWFIEGCHEKRFLIKTPFTAAADRFVPDSFADLRIGELLEKWPVLTRGLDSRSISVAEAAFETILLFHHDEFIFHLRDDTPERRKLYDEFARHGRSLLARKHHIPKKCVTPEAFLFHHGLSGRNEKIKAYIKNKLFLDCGAYAGDSALALLEYDPGRIYSFDISRSNTRIFSEVMEKNHIGEDRVKLISCGVGAENKTIAFSDGNRSSTSTQFAGDSLAEIITLDSFAADKPAVGFIKADVEGAGLEMLEGMTGLLRRDRPVLSLAIYHSPDEFFRIKPQIESLNLNYRFELLRLSDSTCMEIALFAYPQELAGES